VYEYETTSVLVCTVVWPLCVEECVG